MNVDMYNMYMYMCMYMDMYMWWSSRRCAMASEEHVVRCEGGAEGGCGKHV